MKKILILILCAIFAVAVYLHEPKTDKLVIQFSAWGSQSETALLIPLIEKFEKQNPDIKVEFVHIPQNYFQKLHLLFASNLAPDVVFLNNYYAPKYIQAGLLEDLTQYINKKDFFEKSLDGFTFDGKIYAVPRDVSDLVVYYNKDLFKKYNVPFPKSDWTIKEFENKAKLLSKDLNGDGTNDIWGTSFETDTLYYLPFLMSNGASILSENGNEIILNSHLAVKTIQDYADMANRYNIAPKKSQSASLTMAQLFLQQKIAMQLSGRWLVPKYRQEAKFDWDIVQFPNGSQGSVVNIDSSGYAIAKSSKHKKESLKFVEFISSKDSLDYLSKSGLIVPARIDSAYSDSFLNPNEKPKNAKAYLDTITTGKPTPVNKDYQKITDGLKILLEPVFLGKKKAKDVLQKSDSQHIPVH